jgi:hypothetical protein
VSCVFRDCNRSVRHTYEAGAEQWSAGEITKANEALGSEKHHIHGNRQHQGDPAGKLGLAVCKAHAHLLAAINVPDAKVGGACGKNVYDCGGIITKAKRPRRLARNPYLGSWALIATPFLILTLHVQKETGTSRSRRSGVDRSVGAKRLS